ncbi:hypothetical protein L5515_019601 [Caenorhabditis briggsae]|uniref:Uncharacterized protein n=1 Tax=Caenorhabditis briggsae TaxID=6238 RepID=A0AAE9JUA5_CAEBR|nr:hypothetical protein L5515_019601 [Caenorhabditis briggsae]
MKCKNNKRKHTTVSQNRTTVCFSCVSNWNVVNLIAQSLWSKCIHFVIDDIFSNFDRGYERIIADITLQDNASTSVAQIRLEVETDLAPLTAQLLAEIDSNHTEMDRLRERIAQLEQAGRSKDDEINRLSAENNRLTNELGGERDEKTRLAGQNTELASINNQHRNKISETREMVGKYKTKLVEEQVELQIGNNNTEDVKIFKFVTNAVQAFQKLEKHLGPATESDGSQLTPV